MEDEYNTSNLKLKDSVDYIKFYAYINPKTQKLDSYKVEIKIKESAVEGFKGGMLLSYEIYEMRENSDAKKVTVPTTSKPAEQFITDLQNSTLAPMVEGFSSLLFPKTESYDTDYGYNLETGDESYNYDYSTDSSYYDYSEDPSYYGDLQ